MQGVPAAGSVAAVHHCQINANIVSGFLSPIIHYRLSSVQQHIDNSRLDRNVYNFLLMFYSDLRSAKPLSHYKLSKSDRILEKNQDSQEVCNKPLK